MYMKGAVGSHNASANMLKCKVCHSLCIAFAIHYILKLHSLRDFKHWECHCTELNDSSPMMIDV